MYTFGWLLLSVFLCREATPRNRVEIIFTYFVMILALAFFSYILGEMSNVVMHQDEKLVATRAQVQIVQTFIKANSFDEELTEDIVKHFDMLQ